MTFVDMHDLPFVEPAPWPLRAYEAAARFATPALRLHLNRRAARGKEDATRLGERWGESAAPRPEGPLLWAHAASVGECLAALPVVEATLRRRADLSAIITTGTRTSAAICAERAPARARHLYAPIDAPQAVAAFLDHWRPDAGLFLESEIWPNLLRAARRRGIRLALLNGRMSARSARNWRRAARSARHLLGAFDLTSPQSAEDGARLESLGARTTPPNPLKLAAAANLAPAPWPERPAILAASIHPEDAPIIGDAWRRARKARDDARLILAPRHPERAEEIVAAMGAMDRPVHWRSTTDAPSPECGVFVVDRIGELPRWIGASWGVALGGGGGSRGGHNPLEAAAGARPVAFGPDMANARAAADALIGAGAAASFHDAESLAEIIGGWLNHPAAARTAGAAGRAYIETEGRRGLDDAAAAVLSLLDRDAQRAAEPPSPSSPPPPASGP